MEKFKNEIDYLKEVNGDIGKFSRWLAQNKSSKTEGSTYEELFEIFKDMLIELNRNNPDIMSHFFDNLMFRDNMSKFIENEDKPGYKYDELLKAMAKTITEA